MPFSVRTLTAVLLLGLPALAQPPETIWYDFNAGDATNTAVPGGGNGTSGATVAFGPGGALCSGDGDVVSQAVAATTQIDTGWPTSLGTSDWSIGCHLDLTAGGGFPNYFQYLWGDATAGGWRVFVDGAAGNGNVIMRGPVTDVIITGGGSQTAPVHLCWVYDSAALEIRGYLNGVLNVTVPQAVLSITGTGAPDFTVCRYNASVSSLRTGVRMDDFRLYGRAIDVCGVGSGSELDAWVTSCTSNPAIPEYQVNTPAASADIEGVMTGGATPASYAACIGETLTATYASTLVGSPFEIALTLATLVPGSGGGVVTPGGQIVNLDLTHPSLFFLFGGLSPLLVPFPGTFTAPFSALPGTFSAQALWFDPSECDFVSLSQGIEQVGTSTCIFPGPTLNDSFVEITAAALNVSPFTFYGVSYTSFFVNSNGHITFTAGNLDPAPTVVKAAAGVPLIGVWCDLNPELPLGGGTITISRSVNDNDETRVEYTGVPSISGSGTADFTIYYVEPTGEWCITEGPAPDPGGPITTWTEPTFLGMSPGGGATDPGAAMFGPGGAGAAALSTDMIYEFGPGSSITATASILFTPDGMGNYTWVSF